MGRPKQALISRRKTLEVALRIIDEEGLDALSIRRLGDELNVRGISLYHHFPSKEHILIGACELALCECQADPHRNRNGNAESSDIASSNMVRLPDSNARRISPALSCPLIRKWWINERESSSAPRLAIVTVAFSQAFDYPKARKGAVVDDYFGTKVPDPYRWLEDPDSPETVAWVKAENRLTSAYMEKLADRASFRAALTKLWNYPRYTVPDYQGHRYLYQKNEGLQNQSVIYTLRKLSDQPTVLLDPNLLASDGTVAVTSSGCDRKPLMGKFSRARAV